MNTRKQIPGGYPDGVAEEARFLDPGVAFSSAGSIWATVSLRAPARGELVIGLERLGPVSSAASSPWTPNVAPFHRLMHYTCNCSVKPIGIHLCPVV
jgi:hypothetical protein